MSGVSHSQKAIGVNQSWQNVEPSRANNVNYTNTTGRPIMVAVSAQPSSQGDWYRAYIDDVMIMAEFMHTGTSSGAGVVFFIVPNGATYRAHVEGGVSIWYELR